MFDLTEFLLSFLYIFKFFSSFPQSDHIGILFGSESSFLVVFFLLQEAAEVSPLEPLTGINFSGFILQFLFYIGLSVSLVLF